MEKKLTRSKEALDRYVRDSVVKGERSGSFDHSMSMNSNSNALGSLSSSILNPNTGMGMGMGSVLDETVAKHEREIKDDVRALLRAIANRDQMTSASRRAYQTLDRTTKKTIFGVIKQITIREREAQIAREVALVALEEAVRQYSIEEDEEDFITRYSSDADCFMQSSQALNILGDLAITGGGMHSRNSTSGNATPSNIGSGINATTDGNNHATNSTIETTSSSTSMPAPAPTPSSPFSTLFSSLASVTQSSNPPTTNDNNTKQKLHTSSNANTSANANTSTNPNPCKEQEKCIPPPIAYEDKANSSNANQLTSSIHEYLSCIFYMTNSKQLHPKYIAIIERQAKTPITQIPLDVLVFCREFQKAMEVTQSKTIETTDEYSYNIPLVNAVNKISDIVRTKEGRAAFVTCLNTFRSKQVNVGISYGWLAAIMWLALDQSHSCNDVRSAKVIMMLSQVYDGWFYACFIGLYVCLYVCVVLL